MEIISKYFKPYDPLQTNLQSDIWSVYIYIRHKVLIYSHFLEYDIRQLDFVINNGTRKEHT